MRKLCWWVLPCSGAIFTAVYFLPEALLLPLGLCFALAVALGLRFNGKTRLRVMLFCAGVAFGLLWTGFYGLVFRAPALRYGDGAKRDYLFAAQDYPKPTSKGVVVTVRLRTGEPVGPKAILYADSDAAELLPGDLFCAPAALSASENSPDTFGDAAKGIYLRGWTRGTVELSRRPKSIPPIFYPQVFAKALKDSVHRVFPPDGAGFVIALLTGSKSELPDGLYSALQRSGTAHIAAVSGLHVTSLAAFLAFLLGRRRKLTFVLTAILLLFYVAATGSSPSALRAALVYLLCSLAPLVEREEDRPTLLSLVLVLLLLACPYAAASLSLQLSFSSVAGIYLISKPILDALLQDLTLKRGKLRNCVALLLGTLSVSLGAQLFSTPLIVLYYGSLSLAGVLTNLLALWAVSLIFLLGMSTALVGMVFPALAALLAFPSSILVRLVTGIARWVAALPFSSLSLASPIWKVWFWTAYGIILIWLCAGRKVRPVIPLSAIALTLCAALVLHLFPYRSSCLTAAVLDVGQGAATLLYSGGHAVLVDCGGNGENAGDVAADYLQGLGTSALDALVLTHFHSDHANGVPELLARLQVRRIYLPDVTPEEPLRQNILALAEDCGCPVELLTGDAQFSFGGATLNLFEPLGSGTANEEGLSVLCSAGNYDILITGDMDEIVEKRLIRYKSIPDIELLVVGHHGSKTSTSEELLLHTSPETAVISCGKNNYGHPTPEVMERLGAAGCTLYRTDLMGSVTVYIKEEQG